MKTYAKLNNGVIEFAPSILREKKRIVIGYNLEKNERNLFADGYKVLIDREKNNDGQLYDLSWIEDENFIYKTWVKHVYTDFELEGIRNRLYGEISDPILMKVQRGAEKPETYIKAVAQIKFDNKYSDEQEKNLDDFFLEAAKLWNEVNPNNMIELNQ